VIPYDFAFLGVTSDILKPVWDLAKEARKFAAVLQFGFPVTVSDFGACYQLSVSESGYHWSRSAWFLKCPSF
jgi:hypothetical protein